MNDERRDSDQIAAFRALARRITDLQSEQKFEEALRRLMAQASLDEAPQLPELDVIGQAPANLQSRIKAAE